MDNEKEVKSNNTVLSIIKGFFKFIGFIISAALLSTVIFAILCILLPDNVQRLVDILNPQEQIETVIE